MNRFGIVLILLGCFCIYLAAFGLSVPGLASLELSGGSQNFLTYTENDPSNYLTVTSTRITAANLPRQALCYVSKNVGSTSDFSLTFSFSISSCQRSLTLLVLSNQVGGQSVAPKLQIFVWYAKADEDYPDGTHLTAGSTYVGLQNSDNTGKVVSTKFTKPIFTGQTYSVSFARASGSATMSVSGGTGSASFSDSTSYSVIMLIQGIQDTSWDPLATASGYIENLVFGGGSTPPPTTQGQVTVWTQYWTGSQWQYVSTSVTVTKDGVSFATWTTSGTGSYGPVSLDAGTYVFSASYNSVSATPQTVVLAAGDSKTVSLTIGTGTSPPITPPGSDPLQALKEFLATPTVRAILVFAGAGLMGVGSLTQLPSKRRPTYTPDWYY